MSDGHRSSRSTGRVSCKSTELKRCSMVQMFWNKYEVSLASPAWTQIRRPSSKIKFRVVIIKKNLSPPAQSCSRKTSKTRLDIQNYGCNGNLLCCHGVVEKPHFLMQSHGKALEKECCLPGGPIYKISYDCLTIMPKLRSTNDGRLIYQKNHRNGARLFLGTIHLQNCKIAWDSVRKCDLCPYAFLR